MKTPDLRIAALTAAILLTGGVAPAKESTLPATDAATATAIDKALAGGQRSDASKARDLYRHPKDTLEFFGFRRDMKVVEIWPGGGWYTEVLAPVLRDEGHLYAAHVDPGAPGAEPPKALVAYREKLASNPGVYDKVTVTAFGPNAFDIAPPGSVDMVVTFRNIHNWMGRDWAPQAFAAMYKALKPGGVLGVEEHRGNPAVPQDPKAKSGYVNEDYAIRMIEAAGFKFVAKSDVNANPKDTKDYEGGVWTLPPTLRLGDKDKDKWLAIGESDRMTLKFVKPE
jgi:predicted methyltransferase